MRQAWWLLPLAALVPLGYVACGSSSAAPAAAVNEAACDAPKIAPSNGSCWIAPSTSGAGGGGLGGGAGFGGGNGAGGGSGAGGSACPVSIGTSACAVCISQQCCTELEPCYSQGDCILYFAGSNTGTSLYNEPGNPGLLSSLYNCATSKCAAACTPVACNPVTSAQCNPGVQTAEGPSGAWACGAIANPSNTPDVMPSLESNGIATDVCWPPPNPQTVCEACNSIQGPYCGPGMKCLDGYCARYCCDDGDCGSGTCDKATKDGGTSTIGVCVKKTD